MGGAGGFDEDGTIAVGDLDASIPAADDSAIAGRDHTAGPVLERVQRESSIGTPQSVSPPFRSDTSDGTRGGDDQDLA